MSSCTTFVHADDAGGVSRRKLASICIITTIFMVAELIGGYLSGSIAIVLDAVHLTTDIAGFLISLLALHISRRPPTMRFTFGYHRAEVLGALSSIVLIWILAAIMVQEAIARIWAPKPVDAQIMLIVSGIGIGVNIIMGLMLHHHPDEHDFHRHHGNMNVRAAFIHILGDLAQSVGVFLAALLIYWRPKLVIVDPLCTLLFSLVVVGSTVYLVRDIMMVIMEAVPSHIDLTALQRGIMKVDQRILSVNDLHIWALSPGKIIVSLHLRIKEIDRENLTVSIAHKVNAYLVEYHGIQHVTIAIESDKQAVHPATTPPAISGQYFIRTV